MLKKHPIALVPLAKTALAFMLAATLTATLSLVGSTPAFADPSVPYWTTPTTATFDPNLIKSYGVRAGSAGPDYLGITNTNFDFYTGFINSPAQYTGTTAAQLGTVVGSGLAIWATDVNVNKNPYYQNLYYNIINPTTLALPQATTWMSNPSASWGDSNGSLSYKGNVSTGAVTIAGLEYNPDIIFGANKLTNWQNQNPTGANSQTIINSYLATGAEQGYTPTFTSNDATNIWTQIYTMGRLASVAQSLKVGTSKVTRYDTNNANVSALNYEKAIRGNLLYIASQIDSGHQAKKTVAYLYAIDGDGVGYFFTPTATGMLTGTDTGADPTTATAPNADYAANNGTINFGYRATLPFVTNTFNSGNVFPSPSAPVKGIVMGVKDMYKTNPACTVGANDLTALQGVDVIIYNTTTLRGNDLIGTMDGKNSSGIAMNSVYNESSILAWATRHGFQNPAATGNTTLLIPGDDFGTSSHQGFGTVNTTAKGMSPLLYCQRNYTADENAKAAWAFSQVYPELYDNNPYATYGWWVNKIYHIQVASVPTVAKYMTNKSGTVTYSAAVAASLESYFETGYQWWIESGSYNPAWSPFAYYNGSSRASYYSGNRFSAEESNEVGIFAPSVLWRAGSHPALPARYAYSIGCDYGGKTSNDPNDYEGDSTPSAYYAATAYGMAGYKSYYSFYPTYAYLSGVNPGGAGRLESEVVFLNGHASPTHILFGDHNDAPDNMCGVHYTNDLDSRNTTGYRYAGLQQPGRDLSGVRLISFLGCDTAGYPNDAASQSNNLCTRATDDTRANGNYADAALGFTDSIYSFYSFSTIGFLFGDPFNASGPEWIQRYNDALVYGYTIEEAVDYANEINTFANWGQSAHIEGDRSTTIVP